MPASESDPNQSDQSAITDLTKLKPVHFADLIRTAQLVYNPASCASGIDVQVDWQAFGMSLVVEENLRTLGAEYRYEMPNIPPEEIWGKLLPETRIWFVENREQLWKFEEYFPALDED